MMYLLPRNSRARRVAGGALGCCHLAGSRNRLSGARGTRARLGADDVEMAARASEGVGAFLRNVFGKRDESDGSGGGSSILVPVLLVTAGAAAGWLLTRRRRR